MPAERVEDPPQDHPIVGLPAWLNRLAAHCRRYWVAYGLWALIELLLLLIPRNLSGLNLLQLAGSDSEADLAIRMLGGGGAAREVVWLNVLLLVPWTALLIGTTYRIHRFYYSVALARTAIPVIWGLVFALALGLMRSLLLLIAIPDVGGGWLIASSAAGWATWIFIILAVLYTVPMLLARWLPAQWSRWGVSATDAVAKPTRWDRAARFFTLDPLTADEIRNLDPDLTTPTERSADWGIREKGERRRGISVSGGGVRSAAFNLGAFQALDEHRLYDDTAYVAAVSGGSYTAGAFAISRLNNGSDPPPFSRGSPEEGYLRRHSTYLAPGFSGVLRLLVRLVMGIAANVIFIGATVFVLGAVVGFFISSYLLYPELRTTGDYDVGANTWWALAVLAALALFAGLAASLRRYKSETNRDTLFIVGGLLTVMALVIWTLHVAIPWTIVEFPGVASGLIGAAAGEADPTGANVFWWLQIGGIGAVLFGAVRAVVAKNRSVVATLVAGLIVPILAASGFLFAVNSAAKEGVKLDGFGLFWLTVVLIVALLSLGAMSDLTTWSMHPFYKRRLASAFAVRRESGKAAPVPFGDLAPISDYGQVRPKLVICAAANVVDPGITPPGRYALTFGFSSEFVGGPQVGWIESARYAGILGERRREDITVPAAVAISGAAVSPGMGKMGRGKRALSSILALANVRLGVWLPNPRWVLAYERAGRPARTMRPPRVTYLAKELLGRYSVDDRFLYVTDGGHWENLGLVELLRRGCTDVFCFDAAGDKPGEYSTLGEAIALARAELGIDIEIDPLVMRAPVSDKRPLIAPAGHVFGTLSRDGQSFGRIVYVKATLTEGVPWDVRAYAEKHPDFPNQPTFDQLFEDDQFEAYRALGYYQTNEALAERDAAAPSE